MSSGFGNGWLRHVLLTWKETEKVFPLCVSNPSTYQIKPRYENTVDELTEDA